VNTFAAVRALIYTVEQETGARFSSSTAISDLRR
jgi:hypothetical protein